MSVEKSRSFFYSIYFLTHSSIIFKMKNLLLTIAILGSINTSGQIFEKRNSNIYEGEAIIVQGDNESYLRTKNTAILEAKKDALLKFGSYLEIQMTHYINDIDNIDSFKEEVKEISASVIKVKDANYNRFTKNNINYVQAKGVFVIDEKKFNRKINDYIKKTSIIDSLTTTINIKNSEIKNLTSSVNYYKNKSNIEPEVIYKEKIIVKENIKYIKIKPTKREINYSRMTSGIGISYIKTYDDVKGILVTVDIKNININIGTSINSFRREVYLNSGYEFDLNPFSVTPLIGLQYNSIYKDTLTNQNTSWSTTKNNIEIMYGVDVYLNIKSIKISGTITNSYYGLGIHFKLS